SGRAWSSASTTVAAPSGTMLASSTATSISSRCASKVRSASLPSRAVRTAWPWLASTRSIRRSSRISSSATSTVAASPLTRGSYPPGAIDRRRTKGEDRPMPPRPSGALHSASALATDYVELRCRSAFSFLEGASNPEDLAQRAAELEHPALALADRGGLYGAPRFHQAAQAEGVRAIVGAELDLDAGPPGARVLLLVESREGYRHLARLVTRGHGAGPSARGAAPGAG